MKLRFLEHLACPLDRTPLELRAWETTPNRLTGEQRARAERLGVDPASLEQEIVTGLLVNPARRLVYPIYRGVPRLLTFRTGVADEFHHEHEARLKQELAGYSLPDEPPMPGESDVLRTFSSEWVNYDWDGQVYWDLSADDWLKSMRFILDLDVQPVRGQLVLEAGIGVGGVADYVSREGDCEVVGLDLGYAVEVAYRHFNSNPLLHIVQASVFAPPFRPQTFGFVYSWGVIHHTFSTRSAFDHLAELPKDRGRLFIWVYSFRDEQRTLVRRGLTALERVIRPIVWRLPERMQSVALTPLVPLYMAHQWWLQRAKGSLSVNYGIREALHAARDRFTPRYVHRHTDEEMISWFSAAGYENLKPSSQRQRPDYVPISFTACTGVSGIRRVPSSSREATPVSAATSAG